MKKTFSFYARECGEFPQLGEERTFGNFYDAYAFHRKNFMADPRHMLPELGITYHSNPEDVFNGTEIPLIHCGHILEDTFSYYPSEIINLPDVQDAMTLAKFYVQGDDLHFSSAQEMLDYIKEGHDICEIHSGQYVFAYNENGSICSYYLSPEKIEEIAKDNTDRWDASLGRGGSFYMDPVDKGLCIPGAPTNLDLCQELYQKEGLRRTEDVEAMVRSLKKYQPEEPPSKEHSAEQEPHAHHRRRHHR